MVVGGGGGEAGGVRDPGGERLAVVVELKVAVGGGDVAGLDPAAAAATAAAAPAPTSQPSVASPAVPRPQRLAPVPQVIAGEAEDSLRRHHPGRGVGVGEGVAGEGGPVGGESAGLGAGGAGLVHRVEVVPGQLVVVGDGGQPGRAQSVRALARAVRLEDL